MIDTSGWLVGALVVADTAIRIGLSIRVILRRRPVGVSLAWLVIILFLPFAGAIIYVVIGELRIGKRRMRILEALQQPYERSIDQMRKSLELDRPYLDPRGAPLASLAERTVGIPALPGNEVELLGDWQQVFDSLIVDIGSATRTCHIEVYIWQVGGRADDVAAALMRASARGVTCRILVDAVGSSRFLASDQARRLRNAGVLVQGALSGNVFHLLVKRFDLRMHRKIILIDDEIAYTGSLNLVDPRYFKVKAKVGQWIDAMIRLTGPAVEPLAVTFLRDWSLDSSEDFTELCAAMPKAGHRRPGGSSVQVVPTGPTLQDDALQVLLMAIYMARRELIVTTPYFVPDEALLTALVSAARRGVEVTLVVPSRVDSVLVRFASQPHLGELLASGVRILRYGGGLLHVKSLTIDGDFALFGSVNLDPRSLYLNFEITLIVYDRKFAGSLRSLQQTFIANAQQMLIEDWQRRTPARRLLDNTARLLSPLL